jgi:hypothetical protein
LRLHLSVTQIGPHYLPQQFQFDLPRSLNRAAADSVFRPRPISFFRSPGAPVLDGWAVLRVHVTQTDTGNALGGVVVRVFRNPRGPNDEPIGAGMTEWRGRLRGEALVPIARIARFRPGAGNNVVETTQSIAFEAMRDSQFTGAANDLPNVPRIVAGPGPGIVLQRTEPPPTNPPTAALTVEPPLPLNVRAGAEVTVHLTMS